MAGDIVFSQLAGEQMLEPHGGALPLQRTTSLPDNLSNKHQSHSDNAILSITMMRRQNQFDFLAYLFAFVMNMCEESYFM